MPDLPLQGAGGFSETSPEKFLVARQCKGWSVNLYNNWWHTGALDGTASEWVRSSGGYTWIIILNKRNITAGNFWSAVDNLGWNCLAATTTWPTWDLMESPKVNASNLNFSNVSGTSVTVNWTNGNGGNRLLVVRADNSVNAFPLDGTDYTGNASFGAGTVLGADNYIAYNGTGNTVTLTGLTANKKYYFRLAEYNKNMTTGNNALYLLGSNPQGFTITASSFSFTGNGNWSNAANWSNNLIPPSTLSHGAQIIINPSGTGECILDVSQTVSPAASVTVMAGKKFKVLGNPIIQ